MKWDKVTEIIKENVSKQNFDTWINPLQIRELADGRVVFSVPNRFFRDWLNDHYIQLIKDTIYIESGIKFDVEFVIEHEHDHETKRNTSSESSSLILKEKNKKSSVKTHQTLNNNYNFDRFVVGSSNQFAHAAAMAVAEQPATNYNPLFIYGGVGLGKTHLINAIGLQTIHLFPNMNVVYVSAEVFMNDLINSIRYEKMQKFRERFRNIDCLLMDDIQFIAGKERTQEEFFHTFNTLHDAGKQIVVTSDKFPKEIPNLESRLRSRFEWGLIADIQPPDIETRIAILKKKAAENNMMLPDDVAMFLAVQAESNIRELEGYLVRVSAYSSLTQKPVDIDLTKQVLKQVLRKTEKREVEIEDILKVVCAHCNIKMSDIKSNKKNKNISEARQLSMFLAREMTNTSFPEIGEKIGGRDHSTVIYSCKKMKEKLENDLKLNEAIEEIKEKIMNRNA